MLRGGYHYNFHRGRKKDGGSVWRCTYCRAVLKIDVTGYGIISESEHSCEPDLIGTEIYFVLNKCKTRLRNSDNDVKIVYDEEFKDLIDRGFQHRIPSLTHLRKLTYKWRTLPVSQNV